MDAEHAAESFLELFHQVFLQFQERRPGPERELTHESLGVLEHLSRSGPLTVTEASRHFGRSQAAMSEIIARLEARGLLTRMPDERDRRRTLVWLSDDGLATWRRTQRPLNPERLSSAFGRMSETERQQIIAGLRRLTETTPPTKENEA